MTNYDTMRQRLPSDRYHFNLPRDAIDYCSFRKICYPKTCIGKRCWICFLILCAMWSFSKQFILQSRPRTVGPVTKLFPFRTGCPFDCTPFRDDIPIATAEDEFYRLTVEWYLGQVKAINDTKTWDELKNSSVYKQGRNFQCSESIARTFKAAAIELGKKANAPLSDKTRSIVLRPQKRMHISLAYLCCLTMEEATAALPIIDEWIDETEFDLPVRFGDIQSWYEQPNAVTNIVILKDQEPWIMMNEQLNERLLASKIPVPIVRKDQMPYHATLLGLRYSNKAETFDPAYEIGSRRGDIYRLVEKGVSERYHSQWGFYRIHHKPKRSATPGKHTGPRIDFAIG